VAQRLLAVGLLSIEHLAGGMERGAVGAVKISHWENLSFGI
jgi:hypothetical protein